MHGHGIFSILIAVMVLVAAIPYVARIRHPEQRAIAAYFIFVTVFVASAAVLFSMFTWLAGELGLLAELGRPGPALLFLVIVFLPAIILASWQARKPPLRRGPPD